MMILCFNFGQMKKNIILILLFFATMVVYSQNIMTAASFFSEVSERYASIDDYMVNMNITIDSSVQEGVATFKRPDMLRIDFSNPAEQSIVFTGDTLYIYLPTHRTTLTQEIKKDSEEEGVATLVSPQGLSLMKQAYTIQYEHSAEPIPIEEGSSEMVVSLILNRKSASETFKQLKVMIYPDGKLIRRIEAVSLDGTKIQFDFSNYRINTGVSSKNFVFDVPPTAKVLNDFLFAE